MPGVEEDIICTTAGGFVGHRCVYTRTLHISTLHFYILILIKKIYKKIYYYASLIKRNKESHRESAARNIKSLRVAAQPSFDWSIGVVTVGDFLACFALPLAGDGRSCHCFCASCKIVLLQKELQPKKPPRTPRVGRLHTHLPRQNWCCPSRLTSLRIQT